MPSKAERTLLIFERLISGQPPPTHADLVREIRIQRSTLSDTLGELRDLGFVSLHDRTYLPGPRLLAFVRGAASSAGLVAGVRRILQQLAAATGETAIYAMPSDGRTDASLTIVPLDRVESEHSLRYVSKLGTPVLAAETTAGHVFLAFRDPGARRRDRKQKSGDLSGVILAELERVRRQGDAIYSQSYRLSIAVAAPVRERNGNVIGALAVVAPTQRLPDPSAVWPALRDAAASLSVPGPLAAERRPGADADPQPPVDARLVGRPGFPPRAGGWRAKTTDWLT